MITELPKQPEDKIQVVFDTRLGVAMNDYFILSKSRTHAPWVDRWSDWQDIMKAAETNPALDDLIKQAEMVYALTK
jgi:hypothetical protein